MEEESPPVVVLEPEPVPDPVAVCPPVPVFVCEPMVGTLVVAEEPAWEEAANQQ